MQRIPSLDSAAFIAEFMWQIFGIRVYYNGIDLQRTTSSNIQHQYGIYGPVECFCVSRIDKKTGTGVEPARAHVDQYRACEDDRGTLCTANAKP